MVVDCSRPAQAGQHQNTCSSSRLRGTCDGTVWGVFGLGASLEHLGRVFDNSAAQLLGETLDEAIAEFLDSNRSPSRRVNEIDNRGSHFYLAKFWAEAVARQNKDVAMKERFAALAAKLSASEEQINAELLAAQGEPVDVGGYFAPNPELAAKAMRPSPTLNEAIDSV